jgi:hypothetical protein
MCHSGGLQSCSTDIQLAHCQKSSISRLVRAHSLPQSTAASTLPRRSEPSRRSTAHAAAVAAQAGVQRRHLPAQSARGGGGAAPLPRRLSGTALRSAGWGRRRRGPAAAARRPLQKHRLDDGTNVHTMSGQMLLYLSQVWQRLGPEGFPCIQWRFLPTLQLAGQAAGVQCPGHHSSGVHSMYAARDSPPRVLGSTCCGCCPLTALQLARADCRPLWHGQCCCRCCRRRRLCRRLLRRRLLSSRLPRSGRRD